MDSAKLELVLQFRNCKPFVPFRIVMRSGARHEIVDPQTITIGLTRVMIAMPRLKELVASEIELVYQPRRPRG